MGNPRDTKAMEAINHKAMAAILIPMDLPRNTTNPTVTLILTPQPHLHLLKKPLKKRLKVKPKLQQHTKNLHLMEDITQPMAVMAKPTPHLLLMNLSVHLHQHMV